MLFSCSAFPLFNVVGKSIKGWRHWCSVLLVEIYAEGKKSCVVLSVVRQNDGMPELWNNRLPEIPKRQNAREPENRNAGMLEEN
jgi:hypothetical protein